MHNLDLKAILKKAILKDHGYMFDIYIYFFLFFSGNKKKLIAIQHGDSAFMNKEIHLEAV